MTKELAGEFALWRGLTVQLSKWKLSAFPLGSLVTVDDPKYHGDGHVSFDGSTPVDQVAVRLGNGNVWWYPVENVRLK